MVLEKANGTKQIDFQRSYFSQTMHLALILQP
jgi:hypothetical protein